MNLPISPKDPSKSLFAKPNVYTMVLGELKYARSHFPSVGILDSSLIVTAGKMDISWEDRQLGQQTVEIFKVT